LVRRYGISYDPRYKKKALRKIYDVGHQSHIHMTDSTHQTIQYIKVMYKDKLDSFNEKVADFDLEHADQVRISIFNYASYWIKSAPLAIKEGIYSIFKYKM
jgi:uncharacterized ubiquitin-like protein YukD